LTNLFYRDFLNPPRRVVSGAGCWLTDKTGRRYIDGSSGAGVSNIGHGVAEINAAVDSQLRKLAFAHSLFFTTDIQEELAARLADYNGGSLPSSLFLSSGSEAVEAAIKLARQYHVERRDNKRVTIIAREQAYHGNTIACLALSGDLKRSELVQPYLPRFEKLPPVYPYRHKSAVETMAEYGRRCADTLEKKLQAIGPETVSAVIMETVVGSTLGAVAPPPGYFNAVRRICDEHGILLILDEVFCGIGRTGTFGAYQQEGITPDIVTNAKGLSGGYQPLSSVSTTQAVYDAIATGSGRLSVGQTWFGHPVACAAGVATLDYLKCHSLVERIAPLGEILLGALRQETADHPYVGEIRGRGLLTAVEFVKDRESKEPFPPHFRLYERLKVAALEQGLICWCVGGCANGTDGDHVVIAPPFVVSEEEIYLIAQRLRAAIDRAISSIDCSLLPGHFARVRALRCE
jgi:adenosylmethionine-8-amino-7-oxononanoate aminotransferase